MAPYVKIRTGLVIILICICFQVTEASCNASGRFGPDCEFTCHCMGNQQCNRTTGECPSGCDFQWVGPACQRRNIVLNANQKVARHSSSENKHDAKLAVDENLSTCSITKNSSKPWWKLWLSSKYNIRNISILTGSNYLDHFKKLQVMVENNTKSRYNNELFDPSICYLHGDTALTSTSIHIGCTKTLLGNQIRIQLASNYSQLTLCDVRIYGECDDGTFGVTCTEKCSTHCKDVCDKDIGTCSLCKSGWKGNSCNKECYETTAALYTSYRNTTADGIKCQRWDSQSPHSHSLNRNILFPDASIAEAANHCRDPDDEGSPWCYTTDPNIRWQFCGIDTCNSECSDGTYGIDCVQNCSRKCKNSVCSVDNGVCNEGCISGYTGRNCKTMCQNGRYGYSCKFTCSGNCKSNATCRKTDGVCVNGCSPGYKGAKCDQICKDGEYGDNCTNTCSPFCRNNTACRKTDGICVDGCRPGYRRDKCDLTCLSGFYGVECKSNCSEHCFRNGSRYCSNVDGSCLHGCQRGWQGINCNQSCSAGTYDRNCAKNCSQNCKNSLCNIFDGTCNDGCMPGYTGLQCNTPCRNGSYGDKCQSRCSDHCKGNAVCRKTDGSCKDGCLPGYGGTKCDERCADGKYGRNCAFNCSGNCRNDSVCWKGDGTCPNGCKDGYTRKQCNEIIGCPFDICVLCFAGGHCLSGCEEGWTGLTCHDKCKDGTYGPECASNCSAHCLNGSVCMHTNGSCKHGCGPGWTGNGCNKVCDDGLYGLRCLQRCSQNCVGGYSNCDNVYGSCMSGCTAGWKGRKCDEVCERGKWGLNCANSCGHCLSGVCRHTDGVCYGGCTAGFKYTPHCDEKCDNGTYGINCSRICSTNCKDICNKQSGECEFCKTGWQGAKCTLECDDGKWGENCERLCAACNNRTCNRFNGACNGKCKPGFQQTKYCDQAIQKKDSETNVRISGGGVAGIVVTFVVLIVISVIVAVLVTRRRLQAYRSHSTFENETVSYSNVLAVELNQTPETDIMYESIKRMSGTEHIYE